MSSYNARMTPRVTVGLLLLALATSIHFGIEYGLFLAGLGALVLPMPQHPTRGHVLRVRAAVEAAWRRLRGRRQAAAAIAMAFAIGGIVWGLTDALGFGWGLLAGSILVASLSFYVERAE